MRFICALLLCATGISVKAQSPWRYSGKLETGYLSFISNAILDIGPDWKGHPLNNKQNGIDISYTNSLAYKDKAFMGIGLGYLNFEGIHGISAFADLDFVFDLPKHEPCIKQIDPSRYIEADLPAMPSKMQWLINIKGGYTHLWNQYPGGTPGGLFELNAGISYKLNSRLKLQAKTGLTFTQMARLVPVKLSLRF